MYEVIATVIGVILTFGGGIFAWLFNQNLKAMKEGQEKRDATQDKEIKELKIELKDSCREFATKTELERIEKAVTVAIEAGFKNNEKFQEQLIEIESMKMKQFCIDSISSAIQKHETNYHKGMQ